MAGSRKTPPLCAVCHHPKSFHGGGGKCRSIGCKSCDQFVPMAAPEESSDGEH